VVVCESRVLPQSTLVFETLLRAYQTCSDPDGDDGILYEQEKKNIAAATPLAGARPIG
jgi:hypothetical protein